MLQVQKKELRSLINHRLTNLTAIQREEKGQIISSKLHNFLRDNDLLVKVIGGYSSLDDEVRWESEFLEATNLAFPKITKGEEGKMAFYSSTVQGLQAVNVLGRTFMEPEEKRELNPEVFIIPGRAFDERGNRLGRGKGFYDRYLQNRQVIKIGLAFSEQIVEAVPVSEQDIRMDYIITETKVIRVD